MCSHSEISPQGLSRLLNPNWISELEKAVWVLWSFFFLGPPLWVAFIFVPLCDPLFFFKVINILFIFDLSLFFPDPYSMVSGNTVIVPRAFEESTLEKRERERNQLISQRSKCTKWECLSFLFSYVYLWTTGKKFSFKKELRGWNERTASGDQRKRTAVKVEEKSIFIFSLHFITNVGYLFTNNLRLWKQCFHILK